MNLTLPAADDFHVHLRNDDRTPTAVAAVRAGGVARALVMPNTQPPIRDAAEAKRYRGALHSQGADFTILSTIKLTADTSPEQIRTAAHQGILAGKLYPQGVTTHSEDGVRDFMQMYEIFEAMQAEDLVLSVHGEVPGAFVMDAEAAFLDVLAKITSDFPKLRIVLEHITTRRAVEAVNRFDHHVAATITDHHLALTLDDVVGSRIQPHHFCMPVAKTPGDRRALIEAVRSGKPSFFSGTDSAPHKKADKEAAQGCAGIFSSPYHLPILATLFKQHDLLPRLEAFTSQFGAEFYRLLRNRQRVCLVAEPQVVPPMVGKMVPFWAGKPLDYRLIWE